MENITPVSTENTRIPDMLDRYLALRKVLKSSAAETSAHLDEDTLTAFAEGSLTRRENEPVVSHLVACKFCCHKTAELVRLDLELAEINEVPVRTESPEPSRISSVLSDILSKMFGTTDGAVFAHEDKAENEKEKEDEKSGE
ncbi:MAG TPA: hypothetical protein VFZ23_04510 [Pyrinomonadaceae bacterium]